METKNIMQNFQRLPIVKASLFGSTYYYIIEKIDEKTYDSILESNELALPLRDDKEMFISTNDIIYSHKVNFSNKDFLKDINDKKIQDALLDNPYYIFSDLNYETGEILFDKVPKGAPSSNIENVLKHILCRLGKPEYIICYKLNARHYNSNRYDSPTK